MDKETLPESRREGKCMNNKPTRCIDPVIKFCQECRWGWTHYPDWVETYEDLSLCSIESGCTLGFDQGRPEDEPTEEELKEFETWRDHNDRTRPPTR